jgi:Yip1-like protein
MENGTQSPRLADLITILYRPRETMRRILDGSDRWVVQVTMLAAVLSDVNTIDASRIGEALPQVKLLPVLAIVALGAVIDALSWVILLYILAWIALGIGRFLGGTARARDVRAAMAWALVPAMFSPLYRIPSVIATHTLHGVGQHTNVHETVLNFLSHGGCSLIVIYLFVQIVFELAVVVLASFTVAEAQRFSTQKGFVNVVATLALPVTVILAAVFTFRS